MKQMLMSQSDLGINLTGRNVYILDKDGSVLDGSDQTESVTKTANILSAMSGEVGMSSSIAANSMDLAVPIQNGSNEYIVYILDNKLEVNSLTGEMFSIILQSLVLGLVICVILVLHSL
jgi:hypothetical protein